MRNNQPSLLHTGRVLLRFNEKELKVLDEYCSRYGIRHRAAALRRIIMERVLSDLGENTTLF